MKPSLWIPCFNEWTQDLDHARIFWWWPMPEDGHLLRRTLRLLMWKIKAWIFEHIILSNDGCTDDTFDGIDWLIHQNSLPRNQIHILWQWWQTNNIGKMGRFLEVINFAQRQGIQNCVMTDADMVHIGWNAFDLLSKPTQKPMIVSHQGEWNNGKYDIFTAQTSWTRSVRISTLRKQFTRHEIDITFAEGCWFWLERLLNKLLPYDMVQERWDRGNTPLFLKCMRHSWQQQIEEVVLTERKLKEVLVK